MGKKQHLTTNWRLKTKFLSIRLFDLILKPQKWFQFLWWRHAYGRYYKRLSSVVKMWQSNWRKNMWSFRATKSLSMMDFYLCCSILYVWVSCRHLLVPLAMESVGCFFPWLLKKRWKKSKVKLRWIPATIEMHWLRFGFLFTHTKTTTWRKPLVWKKLLLLRWIR